MRDADGAVSGHLTTVVRDPEAGTVRALGYVKSAQVGLGKRFIAGDAQLDLVGLVGDSV